MLDSESESGSESESEGKKRYLREGECVCEVGEIKGECGREVGSELDLGGEVETGGETAEFKPETECDCNAAARLDGESETVCGETTAGDMVRHGNGDEGAEEGKDDGNEETAGYLRWTARQPAR